MGHLPGWEFRKHQASAILRRITRQQYLGEYNDAGHYRPETVSTNRGHQLEVDDSINFWDDYE